MIRNREETLVARAGEGGYTPIVREELSRWTHIAKLGTLLNIGGLVVWASNLLPM